MLSQLKSIVDLDTEIAMHIWAHCRVDRCGDECNLLASKQYCPSDAEVNLTPWAKMLTQKQSFEIRVMARQGPGIKAIERELGLWRNTVRRYLRDETPPPAYGPRAVRACKLDP